ncbi:PREDICTED: LRR receptor-like serine/threonine-protein kinase FLS2 isoform X1 [Theobroma cacao]|uniref:LRR receptor-like serine/threonine-protein kinase FLS2 isoform X1 n=1 Tax=Theobroma cacao TaxID=3641 RepID=A0AB32V5V6_THECC|nr:PREDICTED: LRR receptor-like serine/threonine-protein kinase FLS2 isoform X1 [Theobroma cacao]
MGQFTVLGLVLAVLCVITGEYICTGDSHLANCSKPDLEALFDFKSGLNDPENRLSSWQGSNCCQWNGIGCNNSTGAVIMIDLHNPYPINSESSSRYGFWNLSGDISPSLLKLKSLQYLDLSLNTFNDISIPEFLGSSKNLRYLNLSKAGFTGVIPASLGNLSSLQFLDVSSEFGSLSSDSLEWVAGLVSLKHLAMNNVNLSLVGSGLVGMLSRLSFLNELHLSECQIFGSISSLNPVNLTSLSVLDLSFNSFSSGFPDWVVNISSLTYVDLSYCGLAGRIPLGFGELPNLLYLNLAGNSNLSASCYQLLRRSWKKIEVLNLASNKIHGKLPASIGNMASLTNFDLFDNNVEGGIPSSIGKLCSLKSFDLSGNNLTGSLPQFLEGVQNCVSNMPLPNLMYLRLSNNHLVGTLPEWIGQLQNLIELSLNYNLLEGSIPASLGQLSNLADLGLGGNELNGTVPDSFGLLSGLSTFDVSSNHLTGFISEAHFSKLSKLKILHLSANSLVVNVSSDWIPPFQVRNLDMGSCYLGPSFPTWLRSQKEVKFLDFSNASISGSFPNWFWDISGNLSLLNVSFNQLQGQLPNPLNVAPFADVDFSSNLFEGPIPVPTVEIELLDLSNNQLSGPIPQNMSESMPNLIFLSLSSNQLTGGIPNTIGEMLSLQVIDLSRNKLDGSIPPSIGNCSYLKVLDLRNNNLSGVIPDTLGQLLQLQSLHLNNNNLTGSIPPSFKSLSSLETLDLGNNSLFGSIPLWIGDGFPALRILSLRSNVFSGEIPSKISNLSSLQILDLAENNLTGTIPASLGDLKAIAKEQNIIQYLLYGKYRGLYYEESSIIVLKGQTLKFTKTLSLVTSIDLSGNKLNGDFPEALTKLSGLVVLNLSRNHITGDIPGNISDLQQLSSLDLSSNNLSGAIPSGLSSLSFLAYLNLSNNYFSGAIPYVGHLTTFDASSFSGNQGLCGAPLTIKCENNGFDRGGTVEGGSGEEIIDQWFYLSVGLGFAAGILVPLLIISTRKPWVDSYFGLVEKIIDISGLSNIATERHKNGNVRRN